MDPDSIIQLLFLIVLIALNAFFAASEIAIIQCNDARLEKLAEEGNKRAKQLLKMTSQPSRFLATIQIGVTLAGFLASAVAASSFTVKIMALFGDSLSPALYSTIQSVVLFLVTLILSLVTLIFGELVPKRIAMTRSEKLAMKFAGILTAFSAVVRPVVAFLAWATNAVLKLFGVNPQDEPEEVTEEEIRMMVDVGEEKGVIDPSEKDMINNVFEFDARTVAEVMTHRTVMVAMPETASMEEIVQVASEEGYSRIPIYSDDIDSIEGIVYVKDLIPYVGKDIPEGFSIRNIMRKPFFVPETNRLSEIFEDLTAKRQHMAVVVDEYGGTAGLVTMEDLVEAIVGNIQDEYDQEDEDIEQIGDDVFDIEGTTPIDDVCEKLDITIPEGDYDTLGGFVTDVLGRIPDENEHPSITVEGYDFKVGDVEDNRIVSVVVSRSPVKENASDGGDKDKEKEKDRGRGKDKDK